jgi:gamma-glutamylcyclotransferase (GGCT)/AIG2-like uncharacterized protein YtfP
MGAIITSAPSLPFSQPPTPVLPSTPLLSPLPPSPQVHGVLYRLDARSLAALAASASRGGYRVQQLDVLTYGGASVAASVLVSQQSALLRAEVGVC